MKESARILVIDYGSATTHAALAATRTMVTFDNREALPSGVYIHADGHLETGHAALIRAATDADRYVARPRNLLGTEPGTVHIGDTTIDVTDAVAATLRHVHDQALRQTGMPVTTTVLVVPDRWGPQQRSHLRRAAHRAGLSTVTFIDTVTAITADLPQSPVGPFVVCDLGAGSTVTVAQPAPSTGIETLAVPNPIIGGDHLDTIIAHHLSDNGTAETPDLLALDVARTIKETLSRTPTTAAPPRFDQPARIVTVRDLSDLAAPVVHAISDLIATAITDAGLQPEAITAVYLAGGGAYLTTLTDQLRSLTSRNITVLPEPDTAALRGALTTTGTPPTDQPLPPAIRRILAAAIPGIASLVLLANVYATAYVDTFGGYTLITWGELALAAIFAITGSLTATTLLIDLLPNRHTPTPISLATPAFAARALAIGTATGFAIAAMYGIGGSLYFAIPTSSFLRWTLLPILGITIAGLAAAILAATRPNTPITWHRQLTFPHSSTIIATIGMLLLEYAYTTGAYPGTDKALFLAATVRVGGVLIAIATTLTLLDSLLWRILIATPLVIFAAALTAATSTGYLPTIYAIGASYWWLNRVARLITRTLTSQTAKTQPPTLRAELPPTETTNWGTDNEPTTGPHIVETG